ncbi:glycoside hydrolase family 18 protein [Actinoplanes sp. NPDC049265]|uniref:glycoside hydrolase family 18 protein n=1 Tax=Actinoplanes sp. NPDC049265 TaxID=3363902 RepID=UPI003713BC72
MRSRLLAMGAAVLVSLAGVATPAQAHSHRYVKVGYFTQWGIYGRQFPVAKLQTSGAASKLTHINYAFSDVTEDGLCASADAWADWQVPFPAETSVDGVADVAGQPIAGNLNQLAELKAANPRLRVLVSLGGWTLSKWFSDAAATARSRQRLVDSCVDLWLKGNLPGVAPGAAAGIFDGIDLDWEWPGADGNAGNVIRPEDKQNFTRLLATFRDALDRLGRARHHKYELTAFLPAAPAKIDAGFEAKKIFKFLDFGTVQGYDFHGSWEARANQQSALRVPAGAPDNPDFSITTTIDAWLDRGAPRGELVLGLPYYGQGWTGVTGGLFGAATGAAPGVFAAGTEDYKTLAGLPAQGYTVYRDRRAGHTYLYNGTTFWTFDDPAQLRQKTDYIRHKGLGGAMMWSLDGDDASASLTRAISKGLN